MNTIIYCYYYYTSQIVKYTKGQRFNLHHDLGTYNSDTDVIDMVSPTRVVSFFVYLNTLQKSDGGRTEFPKLNLSITPKIGSAIVWSNVRPLNNNIKDLQRYEPDPDTVHLGSPLKRKGIHKLGMNIWVLNKMINVSHI